MAPERRRSARDYERELRRQELAVARALTQVLPTDRPATAGELGQARGVLNRGLRELRQLKRELAADLRQLQARHRVSPGPSRQPPAAGRRRPEALDAYEAADNAVDEVIARWEGRSAQLASEVERRKPRQRPRR